MRAFCYLSFSLSLQWALRAVHLLCLLFMFYFLHSLSCRVGVLLGERLTVRQAVSAYHVVYTVDRELYLATLVYAVSRRSATSSFSHVPACTSKFFCKKHPFGRE